MSAGTTLSTAIEKDGRADSDGVCAKAVDATQPTATTKGRSLRILVFVLLAALLFPAASHADGGFGGEILRK
jgi:hypothetical protein